MVGFAMLAAASVQESHDLALVAQVATLESRVPVVFFFDGFRTSHEENKIDVIPDEQIRAAIDDDLVRAHRARALTPERPVIRGTAHNPDTFFQARESANPYYARVPEIVQRAMDRVQSRLQDGLAFLATVGSTAPFVGLFGTVWGIYHALTAIGVAGQASIDKVAGPVGEALIMTAIGLAVAVPAVLGYNWLVRRNKACMDDVRAFGNDLHSVLLASAGKKA